MLFGMLITFIGGTMIIIGISKKFLGSIGKESSYIAKETAPATEISTEAWAKGLAKGIKKGLRK